MRQVTCPYCGATFKVPETAGEATCPYCGAVFVITGRGAEKSSETHFYYPVDRRADPYDRLMRFLLRQYAAPKRLRQLSTITARKLHYVPIYMFFVKAQGEARGKSRIYGERTVVLEESAVVSVPSSKTMLDSLLENYPFPLAGRRFFNPQIMRMGAYYEPRLDENDAREIAKASVLERLRLEAAESLKEVYHFVPRILNVEPRGLAHYPVWEIHYRYAGDEYTAFVDGATGVVIKAEYPQTVKGRTLAIGAAAATLGAGVAGGLGYMALVGSHWASTWALLAGLVTGGAAAAPAFGRGVRRRVTVTELEERG